MSTRFGHIVEMAIRDGILPASARLAPVPERPWPVVLLTGLGAWFAAVPLLAALFMMIGDAAFRGAAPYIIGVFALLGSVSVLRKADLPLFTEQIAVPGLLLAGLLLGIALFRDLPDGAGALAMAALTVGAALSIPQAWLRTLLGAAACGFAVLALAPRWSAMSSSSALYSLFAAVAMWLAMQWLPPRLPARQANALEEMANGWLLAALAALAFWSGMTFLAGASVSPFGGDIGGRGDAASMTGKLLSLLMAGGAAAWIGHRWPSLRRPWAAAGAAVIMGLAWLMPSLGAVLLILSVCATQRQWRLAATAGLAAAWIVGAFYYQLALTLTTKALIMVVAGAVLGALAWLALRGERGAAAVQPYREDSARARWAIAACAAAVLAVANIGIWQKQTLIAEGRPVFVALAPVDPRSLMQGDYMRLAYRLPPFTQADALRGAQRPFAIGKVNGSGVASLERVALDPRAGPGDIAIELAPNTRGWTLASDAWYFAEGEGVRWQNAKYAEFRVAPDGRALLVGLRGPQLEAL